MRLLFKVQLQADYLVRREGYRSRCQHFDHTRVVKISQYLSGYFSENPLSLPFWILAELRLNSLKYGSNIFSHFCSRSKNTLGW